MSDSEDWAFARACDLARTADESFEIAHIAEIEAMWEQVDLDHGDFGFILMMADGQRLYWRFTLEDAGAGRPEDLVVAELAPGERPAADWHRPDQLNERLKVLRRFG
jgi:hypothetical protein